MERNGVTYVECKASDCRYLHLLVDGRAYAEWTHPYQPRTVVENDLGWFTLGDDGWDDPSLTIRKPVVSPFVRRALSRELPAKEYSR